MQGTVLFVFIFVVIIVPLDILYSATAKLTVTSTPSAAKIYLDGADTGQVTPYTLTDIGAGGYGYAITTSGSIYGPTSSFSSYHMLTLRKTGYAFPSRIPFSVPSGQTGTLNVDFSTQSVSALTVTSTPSDAKIYMDSADTGQVTPYTFTDIGVGGYGYAITTSGSIYGVSSTLSGYHVLTLRKTSYAFPSNVRFNVFAGQSGSINVDFSSQSYGTLTVNSTPSGAKIYLDGADTGQVTPYSLTDVIGYGSYSVYGGGMISIPFSSIYSYHTLTLRKAGYALTSGIDLFIPHMKSGTVNATLETLTVTQAVDPNTTNSVVFDSSAGETRLEIPPQSFTEAVTVTVQVPTSVPSAGAVAADLRQTGVSIEITLDKSIQPVAEITISVTYRDLDVIGLDEDKLILARYDADKNVWIPLSSTPDPANNRVSAKTNHLSIFQLMQVNPAGNLSSATIYPNPFRPNQGHTSITFSSLPSNAVIRIYTFSGELVKELTALATGTATWDGKNDSGESVASGVYFAHIKGAGYKKTVKLAVQR